MTASDRDAEARQEIATALGHDIGGECRSTYLDDEPCDCTSPRRLERLMPVVERIRERARAEGAADALEAAADSMDYVEVALGGASYVATELRTRAAIALRADVASEDAG
jgi:hypothetical protein